MIGIYEEDGSADDVDQDLLRHIAERLTTD